MSGSPHARAETIRSDLSDSPEDRLSPSPPAPSPQGEGVRNTGWLTLLLVILPLFGVDLILSSMPVFGHELAAGVTATQASLSVFALGFALMHLILGPLADRYGRRPCLIAGLVLFTGASVACALATSIEMLIAARFVQALGAGAGPLVARAVIRDVYGAQGAGRMMGFVMAFFGVGAIVTPILGGLVVDTFGWRANFYIAAGYGAALLALTALLLPETMPAHAPGAALTRFGRGFGVLLGDRRFVVVTVSGCLIASAMFTWIAGSSFVVQNVFGRSATAHGVIYAASVAGFVAMSLFSARLAPRLGSYGLLRIGTAVAALGGIVGVILGLGFAAALVAVVAAMTLMAMGHGFTLPQSMAASVAPFPQRAATASALFGFLQYGFNSVVVMVNGALYDGSATPMLAIVACLTVASALLYALLRPRTA
jgi:DHA1 family bicyclomycin/chloramphenicol resistance-like MFS transporter